MKEETKDKLKGFLFLFAIAGILYACGTSGLFGEYISELLKELIRLLFEAK